MACDRKIISLASLRTWMTIKTIVILTGRLISKDTRGHTHLKKETINFEKLLRSRNGKKIMELCIGICFYNKAISLQNKSTNFLLKLRRNCELLASLQELWMESFRMLIICFIVSKAFSMWKLSGCPASVYFESCCENNEKKTWKLSFHLQLKLINDYKPWPNRLASRRKLKTWASWKLGQVENLGLLATPFGQALRALALTCDDLRSLWSRSNLHASQNKFFTVWPPYSSRRKLSDAH